MVLPSRMCFLYSGMKSAPEFLKLSRLYRLVRLNIPILRAPCG